MDIKMMRDHVNNAGVMCDPPCLCHPSQLQKKTLLPSCTVFVRPHTMRSYHFSIPRPAQNTAEATRSRPRVGQSPPLEGPNTDRSSVRPIQELVQDRVLVRGAWLSVLVLCRARPSHIAC